MFTLNSGKEEFYARIKVLIHPHIQLYSSHTQITVINMSIRPQTHRTKDIKSERKETLDRGR